MDSDYTRCGFSSSHLSHATRAHSRIQTFSQACGKLNSWSLAAPVHTCTHTHTHIQAAASKDQRLAPQRMSPLCRSRSLDELQPVPPLSLPSNKHHHSFLVHHHHASHKARHKRTTIDAHVQRGPTQKSRGRKPRSGENRNKAGRQQPEPGARARAATAVFFMLFIVAQNKPGSTRTQPHTHRTLESRVGLIQPNKLEIPPARITTSFISLSQPGRGQANQEDAVSLAVAHSTATTRRVALPVVCVRHTQHFYSGGMRMPEKKAT